MDVATYFEIQKINEKLAVLEEINAKFEYLYGLLVDKGIIPKPKKVEKKDEKS